MSEHDLSGEKIAEKIIFFLYNRERLKEMSEKSAALYRKTAAEDIINLCRELKREK
jgi:UDP-N-acetylglucosamine:LPS N-acetylglucosamine transferase